MTDRLRRGKLSQTEIDYVRKHSGDKTLEQIASDLKRTEESLRHATIDKIVSEPTIDVAEADLVDLRKELRRSYEWVTIKKEFTEDECKYFENRYAVLMSQFKDDLLSTEKTQLFILIKIEILMSKNLQDRKRATTDIERMTRLLDSHYERLHQDKSKITQDDKDFALGLENQVSSSRAAAHSKVGEYMKLNEKHAQILTMLKSTRDQRIERIQNSKVSFLDLIRSLTDKAMIDNEGKAAGLAKMATDKSYRELGELHEYIDGTLDRPILSPETSLEDN